MMKIHWLLFIGVIALVLVTLPPRIIDNLNHLRILKSWASLDLDFRETSDSIQDGIPDDWLPYWWGGATEIYQIEENDAFSGNQAIKIIHTNDYGIVNLTQNIQVEPESDLVLSVHSKGTGGALIVWFRSNEDEEWVKQGFGGYNQIPDSVDWRENKLQITIPPRIREIKVLLQTTGISTFDGAFLGYQDDSISNHNLLKNGGFEIDGINEEPLEWWNDHVNVPIISLDYFEDPDVVKSYANIADMLQNRYGSILERADSIYPHCSLYPDMTNWLIELSPEISRNGGLAAEERLYQLAIKLMPDCPQPYAALAKLYESNRAYTASADLYHQAALLAAGSPIAGRYYFEEGFTHLNHTGNNEAAIAAFQTTESYSGWERGWWDYGLDSLFLGKAFEVLGYNPEAIEAYQRVIDCDECSQHHEEAADRLKALNNEK